MQASSPKRLDYSKPFRLALIAHSINADPRGLPVRKRHPTWPEFFIAVGLTAMAVAVLVRM